MMYCGVVLAPFVAPKWSQGDRGAVSGHDDAIVQRKPEPRASRLTVDIYYCCWGVVAVGWLLLSYYVMMESLPRSESQWWSSCNSDGKMRPRPFQQLQRQLAINYLLSRPFAAVRNCAHCVLGHSTTDGRQNRPLASKVAHWHPQSGQSSVAQPGEWKQMLSSME